MRTTVDCEIIDFHCHPFVTDDEKICNYAEGPRDSTDFLRTMDYAGIGRFCGSVVKKLGKEPTFEQIHLLNLHALELRQRFGERYIVGVHVHPHFVRESCDELEAMKRAGVKLVGELVPYQMGYIDYDTPEFVEILGVAGELGMVVNIHSSDRPDNMDALAAKIPHTTLVYAHPYEMPDYLRHVERMKKYPNVCLDLSGGGLFRYGMLAYGVNAVGAERFLFGTDYPVCSATMNIFGVLGEIGLTDDDCRLILRDNAVRLLGLSELKNK